MGFGNSQPLTDLVGACSSKSHFVLGFESATLKEAQILSILLVVLVVTWRLDTSNFLKAALCQRTRAQA